MYTKAKARIVICCINLFSLVLILFFPGSATLASAFAILASCDALIIAENVKEGKTKKDKVLMIVEIFSICIISISCFLIFSLIFCSQIIVPEAGQLNEYYIMFKPEMAILGGIKFKYWVFMLIVAIIDIIFEVVGVIKAFMTAKTSITWAEATLNCIK